MDGTVLFADVAGSTALYDVLGDQHAFELVDRCLATMAECTIEFRGRVVKTIGDAVMAVFAGADDAAAAAAEMQLRIESHGPPAGVRLGVRIGFRHGPLVERDGDLFGDTVNLASRLCDLASRGQIVTDRDTATRLSVLHQHCLRPLYPITVKGKAREIELIEYVGPRTAADQTAILVPATATTGQARLHLTQGRVRVEMGPDRRKVTIGRDHEADFTIHDTSASRAHATVERRRERFVLTDHSSNGTYVSFEGRNELHLHHEEQPLFGRGLLSFGQPRAQAAQVVEFVCSQAEPTDHAG